MNRNEMGILRGNNSHLKSHVAKILCTREISAHVLQTKSQSFRCDDEIQLPELNANR